MASEIYQLAISRIFSPTSSWTIRNRLTSFPCSPLYILGPIRKHPSHPTNSNPSPSKRRHPQRRQHNIHRPHNAVHNQIISTILEARRITATMLIRTIKRFPKPTIQPGEPVPTRTSGNYCEHLKTESNNSFKLIAAKHQYQRQHHIYRHQQ